MQMHINDCPEHPDIARVLRYGECKGRLDACCECGWLPDEGEERFFCRDGLLCARCAEKMTGRLL